MSLSPLSPTDTRALFRPVSTEFVALLRRLTPEDWERPTIAGSWLVRDVVAHLIDVTLRRVSFHRDRMTPPPPGRPIASEHDFVAFINGLNAEWVGAARRLSPRVLTDLFEHASADLADWFETLPLEAPALFGVSWAGEQQSEGWFDVGREFVELWHHQEQVRLAVGAASLSDPRYLRATIEIALRGLPHAYRDADATPGDTVVIEIAGPAGGVWTLVREAERWALLSGEPPAAATRVRVSDVNAWRLLFNALARHPDANAVAVEGRRELAAPLFQARAVIV
jgi:uncharacterized protein (TIGR03083 family)